MWEIFSYVVSFFTTVIKLAKQLWLWRVRPELPTTQVEPGGAVSETEELQPVVAIEQQPNNDHDRAPIDNMIKMQLALQVIGTCFAAVGAVLQALQTHANLPASTFPWFCMAFQTAFLASLVSIYLSRHYPMASRVSGHVAVLSGAVAFQLAIVMTLHTPIMEISIAAFFIACLLIVFANPSTRDWV